MEANGMSDIEGKAARVAANERGAVSEFQLTGLKRTDRNIQRLNSFVPRLTRRCPTRLSRPCRSSHSLHSSTSLGMTDHKAAADQPSRGLRLGKHGRRYSFRPRRVQFRSPLRAQACRQAPARWK